MIHEDHIGVFGREVFESFLGRGGAVDLQVVALQDAGQDRARGSRIIGSGSLGDAQLIESV